MIQNYFHNVKRFQGNSFVSPAYGGKGIYLFFFSKNHWLELTRNWILEANQAKNLALQENFSEMKNFLKKIGSNRRFATGRLEISFKNPGITFIFYPLERGWNARARRKTHQIVYGGRWWTRTTDLCDVNAAL